MAIWSKLPICSIVRFFLGKNVCYFCLPFVSYHNSYYFKKIITVNHDLKGCKNVGSKLSICPIWELVLESSLASLLPTCLAPPFYNISNKSLYKLHNFGPNWVQIALFPEDIFSGEIDYHVCVSVVFHLTTTFQKKISESK